MLTLYQHPICPLSRQIRVYLTELESEFNIVKEDFWLRKPDFIKMNPAGTLPILKINDKNLIIGIYPITEYLIERIEKFFFMPENFTDRAEARRLVSWFNEKFYREVTKIIIDEKMIKLMMRSSVPPRSDFIKAAKSNMNAHLQYLSKLLRNNSYLLNDRISCADIAAGAHISVLDYFGEINWDNWPEVKDWYAIIKSRPGFKPLLTDKIPSFNPPAHYADLDF
jgi:glutathione S-transferase